MCLFRFSEKQTLESRDGTCNVCPVGSNDCNRGEGSWGRQEEPLDSVVGLTPMERFG